MTQGTRSKGQGTRALCGVLLGLLTSVASAAPVSGQSARGPLEPFLKQSCIACHDSQSKMGGLDLSTLPLDAKNVADWERWARVWERVHEGEMPPKGLPRPSGEATAAFLDSLDGSLSRLAEVRREEIGRTLGRRLTRVEYEKTLQDLLGIDIPLQDFLPEDSLADGFDTVASAQQMSHFLLEKYLAAADAGLDEAFEVALNGRPEWTKTFTADKMERRKNAKNNAREPWRYDDDSVAVWATTLIFVGRITATKVKERGWYRVRVKASALNPPAGRPLWASLRTGVCYSKAPLMFWAGALELTEQPKEFVFDAWMEEDHMLEIQPADYTQPRPGYNKYTTLPIAEVEEMGVPGVRIHDLSMERVTHGAEPGRVREALLGDAPVEGGEARGAREDLGRLLTGFASRAFRRPVERGEIAAYIGLAEQALAGGESFTEALRAGYRAVLVSPRFLYLPEKPGPLDDHALASRLSYFLWSSMPDSEMLSLADAGKLRDAATLHAQVDRMLADPKAAAFTANFTGQWLKLREIDFTTPDRKLYPEFDEVTKYSMLEETHRFFRTMLDEDLSVGNVVDSDFAILNERLAVHYGVPFEGEGFRQVRLPEKSPRGGLITQGAVLKVTANGTTTSPVVRGAWVTERILGRPVPPPPPNISAVEPDIRGAKTIRQQLEMHRNDASCASCHAKIDPPGFALETFDAVGAWRSNYRVAAGEKADKWVEGPAVDSSYELRDGTKFAGIVELKNILRSETPQIARGLAGMLIAYGGGARATFADRRAVDAIVAKAAEKDHGLRTLLHAVVESPLFLEK